MAGLFYKRPPEATSSESLWVRMGLHLLVGTHNDSGRVYGNSSSHCRGLVSTIMSNEGLVSIAWQMPEDKEDIIGYEIYKGTSAQECISSGNEPIAGVRQGLNIFVDSSTDYVPGQTYFYAIKSVDLKGAKSSFTTPVSDVPVPAESTSLIVDKNLIQVGSDTAIFTINITKEGNGDVNWDSNVTTGQNWISYTSASGGLNNGSIMLSCQENLTGGEREGVITITSDDADNTPLSINILQDEATQFFILSGYP